MLKNFLNEERIIFINKNNKMVNILLLEVNDGYNAFRLYVL